MQIYMYKTGIDTKDSPQYAAAVFIPDDIVQYREYKQFLKLL